MNKARRKEIARIVEKLRELHSDLQAVRDEEQEYVDNMPESLQQGSKGEAAQEATDALDSALDELESMTESLAEVGS